MKENRLISRTLFDPAYLEHDSFFREKHVPYSVAIEELCAREDERFSEVELYAFGDVLRHETACYEPRGFLMGPILIALKGDHGWTESSAAEGEIAMPCWVEADHLRFRHCGASRVLVVESIPVFHALASAARRELDCLMLSSAGLPRFGTRRLLHRLNRELGLEVYFLADNDTWGYLGVSIVKRGALAPHISFPFAAIPTARFIGLRARQCAKVPDLVKREWKPEWSLHLRHLRSYSCFSDAAWQREFDEFEKQGFSVDVLSIIETLGPDAFWDGFVLGVMARREWLD